MNKNLRKPVIAGNWKMNKNENQTIELLQNLKPILVDVSCEVVVCVPFVNLHVAIDILKDSNIKVGAQNCHWEKSGAFTGEVSAEMLKSMGVDYVIVGHSERRTYFGDTDVTVKKRAKAALDAGLNVIICVGEHLEQREQNITSELISLQTKIAVGNLTDEEMKRVIIAYEPIWAIGTGKTATAKQANEICGVIRSTIKAMYGDEIANVVPIQYGGSMNASNAEELLSQSEIDGGLIGGASLKPADFSKIAEAASR